MKSLTKPLRRKVIALVLTALPFAALANPQDGKVVAGTVAIKQEAPTKLGITQTTDKAIVDWKSFSIGANEHTQFYQPSASSVILNRVVGEDPSRILGRLTANGQVFLVNPNGIFFGRNAQIDVAGLMASTHNIRNEDFLAGKYNFNVPGKPGAAVINEGAIRIADTGIAAFVAPSVANRGVIVAKLGKVMLAAANGFTLDFTGDQLLTFMVGDDVAQTAFDVEGKQLTSFVENSGRIEAQGGYVLLTARAAENAIHSVINQSGSIEATSVGQRNGEIVLSGGKYGVVNVTGTVSASGIDVSQSGGSIDISGGFVSSGGTISADGAVLGGRISVSATGGLSLAENVNARGLHGAGGQVRYTSGGSVVESATSNTDVSGSTGGSIQLQATGDILSSGSYRAAGQIGSGGNIDLTGNSVSLLSAQLDTSGATRGGTVRIGGSFQGGKPYEPVNEATQPFSSAVSDLARARSVFVNDGTLLRAEGGNEQGGTSVIWSDQQTTFLGRIEAQGGAAEVSSAGQLRYVNLAGIKLGTGTLLLDPKDIVIGDFSAASGWTQQAIMGRGYSGGKNVDVTGLEGGNNNSYPNYGDNLGLALALNAAGNRLAVGSYDDGFGNAYTLYGSIRLFSFTDNNFSGGALQGTLGRGYTGGKNMDVAVPAAGWSDKGFGTSVALNAAGDRLAVGATGDGAGTGRGAVLLFSFGDSSFGGGVWQASLCNGCTGGKNINVPLNQWVRFGSAVALNGTGDRLAVGVPQDDGPTDNGKGKVLLYSFTDSLFSSGAQVGVIGSGYTGGKNINVSGLENADFFGVSLALNGAGDRLAVGAHGDDGFGNVASGSGAVRLFGFSDGNFSSGTLLAAAGMGYTGGKNINVVGLEANDYFGGRVALNASGDRLAVASSDGGNGNVAATSGAVRVFDFSDTSFSGGVQQAILGKGYTGGNNVNMSNLRAGDGFGIVAMNGAGDRLAVGANGDPGASGDASNAGAVYLFSAATSATTPAGNILFSSNVGGTSNLDRTALQNLLSAGTAVSLQASNDITLNGNLATNNAGGNGGDLMFQAGRSVLLNGNINTDNGNLTILANERSSSGVNDVDRNSGAAAITMAAGSSIDSGAGDAKFYIRDGLGNTNNGSGTITLGNVKANSIAAINRGASSASNVRVKGVLRATGSTINDSITVAAAGSYSANTLTLDLSPGSAFITNGGRVLLYSNKPDLDSYGSVAGTIAGFQTRYGQEYVTDTVPAVAAGGGNWHFYTVASTTPTTAPKKNIIDPCIAGVTCNLTKLDEQSKSEPENLSGAGSTSEPKQSISDVKGLTIQDLLVSGTLPTALRTVDWVVSMDSAMGGLYDFIKSRGRIDNGLDVALESIRYQRKLAEMAGDTGATFFLDLNISRLENAKSFASEAIRKLNSGVAEKDILVDLATFGKEGKQMLAAGDFLGKAGKFASWVEAGNYAYETYTAFKSGDPTLIKAALKDQSVNGVSLLNPAVGIIVGAANTADFFAEMMGFGINDTITSYRNNITGSAQQLDAQIQWIAQKIADKSIDLAEAKLIFDQAKTNIVATMAQADVDMSNELTLRSIAAIASKNKDYKEFENAVDSLILSSSSVSFNDVIKLSVGIESVKK